MNAAIRKDETGSLIPTRRAFAEGFEDAATLSELVAAEPDDVSSGKRAGSRRRGDQGTAAVLEKTTGHV